MSLLGNLVEGMVTGGNAQTPGGINAASMIPAVMQLINEHGGLGALVQQLQQGGLAGAVQSWVGSGANQPVDGSQLTQALNGDALGRFAQQLGVDPQQAGGLLAKVLPGVVDHLTPAGQVGEHDQLGELASSLLKGKLFG